MLIKLRYWVLVLILACLVGFIIYKTTQKPQKLRQKIAWVSIRECCFAIESYKDNYGRLPESLLDKDLQPLLGWDWIKKSPVYTDPFNDGWNRPIRYEIHEVERDGVKLKRYYLGSAGSDGIWEYASLADYPGGMITEFERDIIYCDGHSIQWPEGFSKD